MGSGLTGEFNYSAPCGVSLPRFPALSCFASQHIHAAPFGHTLRFGPRWCRREVGDSGRCVLAAMGTPAGQQGDGRGLRRGSWSRTRAMRSVQVFSVTGAMMLLSALPFCAFGVFLCFSAGGLGCL